MSVLTYIRDARKFVPQYNIESYNCTTFAIDVIQAADKTVNIKEHKWTLPDDINTQLISYKARGKIPVPIASAAVSTMANFYGYTPADAAQDLKTDTGTILLQYTVSNGIIPLK